MKRLFLFYGKRYFTSDIKVYRHTGAILFKAENKSALGNSIDAVSQLNKVSKRVCDVENFLLSSLSKDSTNAAILDKQLKEFATEGKS